MAAQVFPQGDGDLRTWMQNLVAQLPAVMTDLALPATFDDALIAKSASYSTALDEQEQAEAVREQKTAAKRSARTDMIGELRSVVNQLNGNTGFTNEMRQLLGLPPRDQTQTPIDPGTEVPSVEVEIIGPQKHRVHFWDAGLARGGAANRPGPPGLASSMPSSPWEPQL
ncbi:MAG TPA: hypothetical protein VES94_07490 [Burkholderiales bacterium]|nr:hypothetical protein [Burkholderiales bacterium]